MTAAPDGWKSSTLGELGRYLNGRAFKKSEWRDRGRPIIRIQNLTGSGDSFNYFKGDIEDRYIARPGDLLVSWAATLGAFIWNGPEAVVNQHIFKVESNIDVGFHKYLLDYKLDELMRHTHGSGMVHITRSRFDAVPVAVPPVDEQRRIVEILEDHLSRLDAAAATVDTVRQRLETWKRLALDQLVREQASGTIKLADLVARVEAGRSFGGSAPPARPDEWGIIKVSAMTWGRFKAEENKAVPADTVDPRYEIQPGDVLVSRANTTEYVGAPVLVTSTRPRLLLSDKSLRIIPRPGTSRLWLATVLGAHSTRRQISRLATGTKDSMRNISQSSLLSVEIPVANAQQQREVVARAAMIEDRAAQLDTELWDTLIRGRVLRRSLLAAAFSGRLL